MKGKEKREIAIQELVLQGYTHSKISEKLGISTSTVERTLRKARKKSQNWLVNLAQRDYANIFREALEGLKQDLVNLNEMLESQPVKNNPKLQLQIRKQITHVRLKYIENLVHAPVVWSMEIFVEKFRGESIEQPKMESLQGISGV